MRLINLYKTSSKYYSKHYPQMLFIISQPKRFKCDYNLHAYADNQNFDKLGLASLESLMIASKCVDKHDYSPPPNTCKEREALNLLKTLSNLVRNPYMLALEQLI